MRQIGMLTALPFIMLGGPLVGFFIGRWLDGKLGTAPYLMIALVIIGLISSAKESYKLIKQASDDTHDDDNTEF